MRYICDNNPPPISLYTYGNSHRAMELNVGYHLMDIEVAERAQEEM
jgi:hypothetical protein